MLSNIRHLITKFAIFTVICLPTLANDKNAPNDVIIGTPTFIDYNRAFPLLDGLFQDEAAIQIKQLTIDPSAANSSSLDATLQSFQLSLQYSQILGIQNGNAAQQTALNNAGFAYQSQLINMQGQLMNQLAAAQQQQLAAQKAVDSAAADATSDTLAALNQQNKVAADNVTALTNQLSTIKANVASISATPSFTSASAAPSGGLASTPTAPKPTSINPPTPPISGSNNAYISTLPPSKLLETQTNLLRERLAHLVSTLSQQSQASDDSQLYLGVFHFGFVNEKCRRKKQVFTTQYKLSCGTVLDLFPRNAAVNIADEKYRDAQWGFSFLASLFSFGLNSAYNREHLQVTQALNQASYITGYGIDTQDFGWTFGRTLGEDAIAPGDRQTYALIKIPKGCTASTIQLISANWSKNVDLKPTDSKVAIEKGSRAEEWQAISVTAPSVSVPFPR